MHSGDVMYDNHNVRLNRYEEIYFHDEGKMWCETNNKTVLKSYGGVLNYSQKPLVKLP
jgi:hypothetical protein